MCGGCFAAENHASAFASSLNQGFGLPGGGGALYYEDSLRLDCDSRTVDNLDPQSYQRRFFNSCANEPGFDVFFEPDTLESHCRLRAIFGQ